MTDASARPNVRRFTADEALRMADAGIIGEDEHVELVDGVLVEMSPQGLAHSATVRRLAKRLRGAFGDRAEIFEEKTLAASPHDLPQPDVAVVRPRADDYTTSHPTGRDVILLVEVAWSSQAEDRRKALLYAAAGVETYWILDLVARKLEVRTAAQGAAYRTLRILAEDDEVFLPETDERLSVRDLLLPR